MTSEQSFLHRRRTPAPSPPTVRVTRGVISEGRDRPRQYSALKAVVTAGNHLARTTWELDEAVWKARAAGCTWASIGRTLAISEQAIWERFGPIRPQPTAAGHVWLALGAADTWQATHPDPGPGR